MFINGEKAREYDGPENMKSGKLASGIRPPHEVLSNGIWHYMFQNFRGNTYKKGKLPLFDKDGNLDFELTVH